MHKLTLVTLFALVMATLTFAAAAVPSATEGVQVTAVEQV